MSKRTPWWLALSLGLSTAALTGCEDKNANKPATPAGGAGTAQKTDEGEEAPEKEIELAKIPPAAMASIKKELGEATVIKRVLLGQKRGKPYYEAKFNSASGERMMVQVAEDGKVYKKEKDDDPEPTK